MKKVSLKNWAILQCLIPGLSFLSIAFFTGMSFMHSFIYKGILACFMINAICKIIIILMQKIEKDDELSQYIKFKSAYNTCQSYINFMLFVFIIITCLYLFNGFLISPIILLEFLIGSGYLLYFFNYLFLLRKDENYAEEK